MRNIQAELIRAFILAAAFTINHSHAQSGGGYVVTERGADYKVLQKTTVENGTNRVHKYTELATGLNYTNTSGQLVESKEQINILPTGGAAAVQGQHKVYFPADIYNGVLEVVTPDGQHLRSRPLGVSYDDGSNTVFIAQLKHALGYLVSSNKVVYRDAFTGFKADLVCTYRRGGFESDLVFRQQPPTPGDYGLDADWSTLQMVTEFFNTPDPEQIPAASDEWYGLEDSTLIFGRLSMTQGRAFAMNPSGTNAPATIPGSDDEIPVYKRWLHLDSRTFLIEEVPVEDLADDLDALPLTASASPRVPGSQTLMASGHWQLPPRREIVADTNQMLMASIDLNREPGVVLDYNEINTSQSDYTFLAGDTYFINGTIYLGGTNTFQGGAVLKYSQHSSLNLTGNMNWPATNEPPVLFTAMDDDSVGTIIDNSTGVPSGYYADTALSYYGVYPVMAHARIGYAFTALDLSYYLMNLNDVQIHDCYNGIQYLSLMGNTGDEPPCTLNNLLFENVGYCILCSGYYARLNVTYSTFNNFYVFGFIRNQEQIYNYNSVFANLGWQWTSGGFIGADYSGLYNCKKRGTHTVTNTFNPFVTAAAADCYLATNCAFHNFATTNLQSILDASLLGEICSRTTRSPQDGGMPDTNGTDLGYHYSVNEDSDHDGLPDWWEWKYFGGYSYVGTNYDSTGTNTLLYDYQNTNNPNVISFSFSFPNQYVSTSMATGSVSVLSGFPSGVTVLVDSTNFSTATWAGYTSNVTVNLGSTQGAHDVWIGLRVSPVDPAPVWQGTTLVLDTNAPGITITNPANNVTFNSSRVNVSGNFAAGALKQITVNGVLAFVHGTNFNAVNVPLEAGTNVIVATLETLTGATNASSINLVTTTNLDGSLNNPVQLQATPVAGFSPLAVTFQVQTNFPGTLQQVVYDFNGDDVADFITNNLDAVTPTYTTNGQYFPFVTLQTTAGRFSSVGGWNAVALDESNAPVRINVQMPPTVTNFASITDPVDLKWIGTNLYVLSGSTATLTEFDASGTVIRSTNGLGVNPSGFDVDASGNVYVAITGSDQVWKLNPADDSFVPDGGFGYAGVIGGSGSDPGEFSAPFDVAVSPDGGTIAITDSGNNRIQRIDTGGNLIDTFGTHGSATGEFDTPKGLTYDASGTLYIVDSGNNRIVMAQDSTVTGTTGTNGTALGQFSGPVNLCVGTRGVYVADTGNNRIQKFDLPGHGLFNITPASMRYAVTTNLSGPYAVVAVNNFTNDLFYVADTANNRVILCTAPTEDADAVLAVWNHMTTRIAAGDIPGAITDYSVASAEDYQQSFLSVGMASTISAIGQIGTLTPAAIEDDSAQYYFEQTIDGETITFPVEFTKENGLWKILEF